MKDSLKFAMKNLGKVIIDGACCGLGAFIAIWTGKTLIKRADDMANVDITYERIHRYDHIIEEPKEEKVEETE